MGTEVNLYVYNVDTECVCVCVCFRHIIIEILSKQTNPMQTNMRTGQQENKALKRILPPSMYGNLKCCDFRNVCGKTIVIYFNTTRASQQLFESNMDLMLLVGGIALMGAFT